MIRGFVWRWKRKSLWDSKESLWTPDGHFEVPNFMSNPIFCSKEIVAHWITLSTYGSISDCSFVITATVTNRDTVLHSDSKLVTECSDFLLKCYNLIGSPKWMNIWQKIPQNWSHLHISTIFQYMNSLGMQSLKQFSAQSWHYESYIFQPHISAEKDFPLTLISLRKKKGKLQE